MKLDELRFEDLKPHAVVESRWKEKIYNPEVKTLDGNFKCGDSQNSYEAAMQIAQGKADEIRAAMIAVCRSFTSKLIKAKE